MTERMQQLQSITRRHFLRDGSLGLGGLALALLSGRETQAAAAKVVDPLAPKKPPLRARAKNVIYLHMAGSPPHLDMFDYKPELIKQTGKDCPKSFLEGKRFAFTSGVPKLLGTPQKFRQHGKSGAWISGVLPHLAGVADELCFIKSMHTDQFNHAPAQLLIYTGSALFGRPSMGSWVTYGLGSESRNLPGFVVLLSGGVNPDGGASLWSSGFLPTVYQGVQCRSVGDPVLYVTDP